MDALAIISLVTTIISTIGALSALAGTNNISSTKTSKLGF